MRLDSAISERDQACAIVPNQDAALSEANLRLQETRVELRRIAEELATLDGQLSESHGVTPEQVKAAEQKVAALKKDVEEKKHLYDAARHEQAKAQARLEEKAAPLAGVDLIDIQRRVKTARLVFDEQKDLFVPDTAVAQTSVQLAEQTASDRETTMKIAQGRVADAQARFKESATALGKPADEVLAEQAKQGAEKAIEDLEKTQCPATDAAEKELLEAQNCVRHLEGRLEPTQNQCETATRARDESRAQLAQAKMKLDALLQSNPITDATLAEGVLAKSRQQLDEDAAMSSDLPTDLGQTEALLERRKADLQGIENEVHEARGALAHFGGAVLKEQLEREREDYERLRASAEELELEFNGTRRLRDVLKESAAKHTEHLGKSLAKPVAEKFLELTAGRYADVAFDPGLRVENVAANGGEPMWPPSQSARVISWPCSFGLLSPPTSRPSWCLTTSSLRPTATASAGSGTFYAQASGIMATRPL
jgi:outer membrane murein-binding lipoprotein Lpp